MIQDAVLRNIKAQNAVSDRIKKDADGMLKGMNLKGIESLEETLSIFGARFAHKFSLDIRKSANSGVRLAKEITAMVK